jgi:hypothetical protein
VDAIREAEGDWPSMSAAAAAAFRDFFSKDVTFHRVVEQCGDLLSSRTQRAVSVWRMRGRLTADMLRDRSRRLTRPMTETT